MCSAGQSMNRWSLEELVKRDPENFLILLQQIIRKTREVGHSVDTRGHGLGFARECLMSLLCVQVQEQCQYELVAPLAIMFFSTLLQVPSSFLLCCTLCLRESEVMGGGGGGGVPTLSIFAELNSIQ